MLEAEDIERRVQAAEVGEFLVMVMNGLTNLSELVRRSPANPAEVWPTRWPQVRADDRPRLSVNTPLDLRKAG